MVPSNFLTAHPDSECAHLHNLSRLIPPNSTLFLGNSLAIREWNLCADRNAGPWDCHVLRGANGIDGNLSFFLGLSAEAEESWAVIGDLTALYDLAAPWILSQLQAGRRRIAVINNGGGKIFSRLPSMSAISANERRVIENQHRIDLEPWARMWGLEYVRIDSAADWSPIQHPGAVLVEVRPDVAQSDAFWAAWLQREREVWR